MERYFNTTGACDPRESYMVDIQKRLEEIKKLVDAGKYFMINRARQYGKTTTLLALAEFLKEDYVVILAMLITRGGKNNCWIISRLKKGIY